jgi:two-component system chemotaxis response regulator CheY
VKKILIVDDSVVQRRMIKQILKLGQINNETLEAANGEDAIEVLGRTYKEIGLILCDWNMPQMSGYEFVEGVAKVPAVAAIPIVMVTTEGTDFKINQIKQAHPNLAGYVVKPFSPDVLHETVAPILKQQETAGG